MANKPKLLILDSIGYAEPFAAQFVLLTPKTKNDLISGLDECDVVLFTGGADISPELYGDEVGAHTYTNPQRDRFEKMVFEEAVSRDKGILGICRGLQLGCALSGGKLIQHTTGHAGGSHLIDDMFGNTVLMTSLHHQMVRPETTKSVVVAWSKSKNSATYLDGQDKEIYTTEGKEKMQEAEIVWFPDTKCLGIQGHPEMSANKGLHKYCQSLVDLYLLNKSITPVYTPAY